MDIGSLLLILALLVLVGMFVIRPVLERESVRVSEENRSESALLAERDRILDAIQELDFDHEMGKIPADEYPQQRAHLLHQGAETLRLLDALHEDEEGEAGDALLEAVISARRALAVSPGGPEARQEPVLETAGAGLSIPDDDLENLIATRRQSQQGKAAGFCHRCGQAIQKNDRFCANCGADL